MRRRQSHHPHHESPHEMRLRAVVDELVSDKTRRPAYLAFAHELIRAERRKPQASSHKPQALDYRRRTKLVVQKWFERGLSGHLMWLIGQEVLR